MDTAAPTPSTATSSPYTWQDANPETPTQAMDGGPQVSQPPSQDETPPAKSASESLRAATVRRVATAAAGVGLVAAAVLTARGLRGPNATAGANVIDYDD